MFPMETRDSSEFSDYWKQKNSNGVAFSAQIRLNIFIYSEFKLCMWECSPAPGLGLSPVSVQTGMKGLRGARWRTWEHWWVQSWIRASRVHLQPRKPITSLAVSQAAWPAGWGKGFCSSTPLSWDPSWTNASSSGAPSTRKTQSCWSGSKGGPQRWSEGWAPLSENWSCAVWRRKGLGRSHLTATFLYIKVAVVTMGLNRNGEHLYWT